MGVGHAQGADLGVDSTVGTDLRGTCASLDCFGREAAVVRAAWTKKGEPGLDESGLGSAARHDLLAIAMPGVQRFAANSGPRLMCAQPGRLSRVSRIMKRRDACQAFGGEMVFPSESASEVATPTTPNGIVARLPADAGPQVVLDVQQSVKKKIWAE
jgi:hypothetical protein